MKKTAFLLCALATFATADISHAANPIFTEDFDDITNGTTLTTSNTDFTIANIGNFAGSYLKAANPGGAGSGASANLLALSTNITGLGKNGLTSMTYGTLAFSILMPAATAGGSFYIGLGDGTSTSFTSSFATLPATTNQLLAVLRIYSTGTVAAGNSGTTTILSSGTLEYDTAYEITMAFNDSDADMTYGPSNSWTLKTGTANIFIDGVRQEVVNPASGFDNWGFAIPGRVAATGLYFKTNGSAGNTNDWEIDNISLWNSLDTTPVPEPKTWALLGLVGVVVGFRGLGKLRSYARRTFSGKGSGFTKTASR